MLKFFVQTNRASSDLFYQNDYISSFTCPMKLKLVPKFSRLKVLQLCRRNLSLEMHTRSLKISCKLLVRFSLQTESLSLTLTWFTFVNMSIKPNDLD